MFIVQCVHLCFSFAFRELEHLSVLARTIRSLLRRLLRRGADRGSILKCSKPSNFSYVRTKQSSKVHATLKGFFIPYERHSGASDTLLSSGAASYLQCADFADDKENRYQCTIIIATVWPVKLQTIVVPYMDATYAHRRPNICGHYAVPRRPHGAAPAVPRARLAIYGFYK